MYDKYVNIPNNIYVLNVVNYYNILCNCLIILHS